MFFKNTTRYTADSRTRVNSNVNPQTNVSSGFPVNNQKPALIQNQSYPFSIKVKEKKVIWEEVKQGKILIIKK